MAHIYQTTSGAWRAQVRKRGVKKSLTAQNRDEVELWAASVENLADERHRVVRVVNKNNEVVLVTALPHRLLTALNEIPHPYHEVMEASVPIGANCGVYFLICDRQIMYVGKSLDVLDRLSKHRRAGRVFDSYSYISCSPADVGRLESLYINAFLPPWNGVTPPLEPSIRVLDTE